MKVEGARAPPALPCSASPDTEDAGKYVEQELRISIRTAMIEMENNLLTLMEQHQKQMEVTNNIKFLYL